MTSLGFWGFGMSLAIVSLQLFSTFGFISGSRLFAKLFVSFNWRPIVEFKFGLVLNNWSKLQSLLQYNVTLNLETIELLKLLVNK